MNRDFEKSVITDFEFSSMAPRIDWSRFENKTIGITGATGMLGSWITCSLLLAMKEGLLSNARIIGFTKSGNLSNLGNLSATKGLTIMNTRDRAKFSSLNLDVLCHAASPASPHLFTSDKMIRDGNLQLLRDIVSDNEVLPDIVFLSTSEVYGSSMSLPIKEDQVGEIDIGISRSIYPTTKLQTELLIQDLSQTFGNRFNIFRVFHTFGPGMRHDDMRSFSSFLWSVSKGNVPRLRTSGTQIRSYLYALDFVVAILDYPISNSVINVGSPKPISVGRFAELACVLGGLDEGPIFEQSQELFLSSPNNFLVPDVVKLSNNGWSPTVDIESAITRTLAWMRNRR